VHLHACIIIGDSEICIGPVNCTYIHLANRQRTLWVASMVSCAVYMHEPYN
jgi:hypothetical protein